MILNKIFRVIPDSAYSIFYKPAFRYSFYFAKLHDCIAYSDREQMLKIATEFTMFSQIEGDYLEFGVYEGELFAAAYHLAQMFGLTSMRFYAFDSFEGLPDIQGVDAEGFRHFSKGEFACDQKTFRRNLLRKKVDLRKVSTIPGWYNEVLTDKTKNTLPLKKAALVYIDCDLYESVVPVLNFIVDYLQTGTIIMFDDWFCFKGDPERGEQRAFAEWLNENPNITAVQYQKFGWQGNSFILKCS
ncbi:MAG TPA: TylF/MycF/NovP-related O-methyltransferase [Chloroflexia bacterium]